VIFDLRPRSPTYLQWQGLELTAENRKALYVPKGFPYGFQMLTDEAEIVYQISAFFAPDFGAARLPSYVRSTGMA
jgi:dTDP-4-dehydrorhamnose 3,5-epimerase